MQQIDPAALAALAERNGVVTRELIWMVPRSLASGDPAPIGVWTGDDHASFVIGAETRTYFGAGAALAVDPITSATGLTVQVTRVTLLALLPEIEDAIRAHDTRLAPVEIHRVMFNPQSRALIAPPWRIFKGWVDGLTIQTGAEGGEGGTAEMNIVSAARAFTRSLPLTRSDAAQRQRNPADRFREYSALAGLRAVHWGEQRPAEEGATVAPRRPGIGGEFGLPNTGGGIWPGL